MNVETRIKLDKFSPRSYQLPFCRAFDEGKFKKFLLAWPRRCLSGDTHILMSDGSFKLLKDICVGDKILSWNGEFLEEDSVKNIWSTGLKNTKKVRSSHYLPIITSEDHVFAHTDSSKTIVVKWTDLKNISARRALLNYAGISVGNVHNPELAEFWGYMLADGYVCHYQQPKFTNINEEIINRVAFLAQKLFKVELRYRKKGNSYDIGFSNGTLGGGKTINPIKELFRQEGCDVQKSERRLPRSFWAFDKDTIISFFSGIIAADGNIYCHKKGFTSLDRNRNIPPAVEITISCGLNDLYAMDLYWLLRKIGIIPQLPYKEKKSNWKIKIAKGRDVSLLLSKTIYGKTDAQQAALKISKTRNKKLQIFKGFYKSGFKVTQEKPQKLFDIETEKNHNFIANGYLVHNSGKDVCTFNLVVRAALRKVGVYYYVFPTYSQGKKVIYDSITNEGLRFMDYIPKELIVSTNSQELKIKLANDSLIQIVGSDNIDSLMGTNPQGIVFSEYALQSPNAYALLRPILAANNGWAVFESTPRGKNHFWEMYQIALHSTDWFVSKLTLDDTDHIPLAEIQKDLQEGLISQDLVYQEYYTSFDMGVEGAYYAKYIDKMRLDGRIGQVPHEAGFKVFTAWDIGVRDSTTILFFQVVGQTVRIIDCYENSKVGLEHYAKVLQQKDYNYGKHIAPHDIAVKEFGSGMTRIEKAKQLGIQFTVAPNISIYDGIEAVRSCLSKVWIDEKNCAPFIKAMENYRQEYDLKKKVYKPQPLHDFSSHFADSMRYLAVSLPKTRDGLSAQELDKRYREAMYGGRQTSGFFREDI